MVEDIRRHAYDIFCHRNQYCAGRNYGFGAKSFERTGLHFLEHTILNVIVEKYDPLFVRNTLCRVEYNRIGRIFTCFAQYFN